MNETSFGHGAIDEHLRKAIFGLYEDKAQIARLLCAAFKKTMHLKDLEALKYARLKNGRETVTALFSSVETETINVTGDSGIAMIKDIIRSIG